MSRTSSALVAVSTGLAMVLLVLVPSAAQAVQYPPSATTTTLAPGDATTTTLAPGDTTSTTTRGGVLPLIDADETTTTTTRSGGNLPLTGAGGLFTLAQVAAALAVAGLLLTLVERNRKAARARDGSSAGS
jgi:hypothetical protein